MEWLVEADSEEAALEMMDDDDKTPWEEGNETWLGPAWGVCGTDMEDRVKEEVDG